MPDSPARRGSILIAGPYLESLPAPSPASAGLPSGWAGADVFVLTQARDFLGDRALLPRMVEALLPWGAKPLPLAGSPGAGQRVEDFLAGAAVEIAAKDGAHVFVALDRRPWRQPLAQAIIERVLGLGQAGPPSCGLSVLDLEPAPGGRVDLSDVPLDKLAAVMRRLLGPGGCPWDREQTHDSLRRYLVEEAAEVLEAVERRQANTLCDELGDLLLQIAFHAALGEAGGRFALKDVVGAITAKMIHRHPHVFADWTVTGSEEVLRNWAALKQAEPEAESGAEAGGTWQALRELAVSVSLAAFEAAFAAARQDPERWEEAAANLASSVAALSGDGRRILGGGTPPREEDTQN